MTGARPGLDLDLEFTTFQAVTPNFVQCKDVNLSVRGYYFWGEPAYVSEDALYQPDKLTQEEA